MSNIKPILLVAIMLVVVVSLGYFVVLPSLDSSVTQVADELSLESVNTPTYSFYFPNNFVKKTAENTELAYFAQDSDGNTTGETVMLEIRKNDPGSQKVAPTDQFCLTMANGVVSENPDLNGTLLSSSVTNSQPVYEGCRFSVSFQDKNSSMTVEVKSIWYKDARDNKLYLVKGNYYSSTAPDMVRTIRDSVNQFSII